MCTLLVAAGVVPGVPFLVVANRDEQLDRASVGPALSADGAVLAPRDLEAGGTWLGLNRHGVFVAITNRFLGPRDPARVSRGVLVADALAQTSARAVHERLAAVPASRHNGFHLVYADVGGGDVLATVSDGTTRAQLVLGRGLHVVTERSFGAGDDRGRLARIRRAFDHACAAAGGDALDLDPASPFTRVLTEHDEASPFDATCIHADALRYGTRSATLLAVKGLPAPRARMLWAEGPPCRTPFVVVPEADALLS
jgi:hypothetical protein